MPKTYRRVTENGIEKIREQIWLHQRGCDKLGNLALFTMAVGYADEVTKNDFDGRGPIYEIPAQMAVGGKALTFKVSDLDLVANRLGY